MEKLKQILQFYFFTGPNSDNKPNNTMPKKSTNQLPTVLNLKLPNHSNQKQMFYYKYVHAWFAFIMDKDDVNQYKVS